MTDNKLQSPTLLKGKIYWLGSYIDLDFIGSITPKKNESSITIANIENIVITDYAIKFNVAPFDQGDGKLWQYDISLSANDNVEYSGQWSTASTDVENKGNLSCNLFTNDKQFMLYGHWEEADNDFMWWAIINK